MDEQVRKANEGLTHCRIVVRPGYRTFYLRAKVPPKDGIGEPKRQFIKSPCNLTPAGLKGIIARAKRLDSDLSLGIFSWDDWGGTTKKSTTSGWLDDFLDLKRSQIQESSLNTQYVPVIRRIRELKGTITTDKLVDLIKQNTDDHSKNRKTYCLVLSQLAMYGGLDPLPIKAIAGKYKPTPVNPAELPTDEQIVGLWESLSSNWKWIYGMMATYGLRPHETFKVSLSRENNTLLARVHPDTKTGARVVLPLLERWTEQFNLEQVVYPNIILEGRDNRRLSERISLAFRQQNVPHTPKALRHAYSCRGAHYGIQPDVMARMMGHSISVHCATYQNAISLAQYQDIFRKAEKKN